MKLQHQAKIKAVSHTLIFTKGGFHRGPGYHPTENDYRRDVVQFFFEPIKAVTTVVVCGCTF